jgi:hypothetical protein
MMMGSRREGWFYSNVVVVVVGSGKMMMLMTNLMETMKTVWNEDRKGWIREQ